MFLPQIPALMFWVVPFIYVASRDFSRMRFIPLFSLWVWIDNLEFRCKFPKTFRGKWCRHEICNGAQGVYPWGETQTWKTKALFPNVVAMQIDSLTKGHIENIFGNFLTKNRFLRTCFQNRVFVFTCFLCDVLKTNYTNREKS